MDGSEYGVSNVKKQHCFEKLPTTQIPAWKSQTTTAYVPVICSAMQYAVLSEWMKKTSRENV